VEVAASREVASPRLLYYSKYMRQDSQYEARSAWDKNKDRVP